MKLDTILKKPNIIYNELEHSYQDKDSGIFYPSCTQVTGLFPKPYLIKWSTKQNYLYMKENWDVNQQYTEYGKEQLLKKARFRYQEKSKESTDFGKLVHGWLENHIKGHPDLPLPKGGERAITLFLDWEEKNIEEWLATEMMVGSSEYRSAGTLDAVAVLKGGITSLIDHKTSNEISPEYNIQTAFYWAGLKEMGFSTDSRTIIRYPKGLIRNFYDKSTGRYKEEEDVLEVKTVMSDVMDDLRVFKNLREEWDWLDANGMLEKR